MINPVDVLGLMLWSDIHRNWTVEDVGRLIMPPFNLGQFTFIQGDQVLAFASWAFLTPEAEEGFLSGERKLMPEDWNAGDRVWLIDAIAPFGHARKVCRQVRQTLRDQGHNGHSIKFKREYGGRERFAEVKL